MTDLDLRKKTLDDTTCFQVDRCVTGLVAQQQCVGPLHTPLADVAVTALSYMDRVGSATAIGEQPIKGLIDPAAGARMSVAEALTNLVFARVTDLKVSDTCMFVNVGSTEMFICLPVRIQMLTVFIRAPH